MGEEFFSRNISGHVVSMVIWNDKWPRWSRSRSKMGIKFCLSNRAQVHYTREAPWKPQVKARECLPGGVSHVLFQVEHLLWSVWWRRQEHCYRRCCLRQEYWPLEARMTQPNSDTLTCVDCTCSTSLSEIVAQLLIVHEQTGRRWFSEFWVIFCFTPLT